MHKKLNLGRKLKVCGNYDTSCHGDRVLCRALFWLVMMPKWGSIKRHEHPKPQSSHTACVWARTWHFSLLKTLVKDCLKVKCAAAAHYLYNSQNTQKDSIKYLMIMLLCEGSDVHHHPPRCFVAAWQCRIAKDCQEMLRLQHHSKLTRPTTNTQTPGAFSLHKGGSANWNRILDKSFVNYRAESSTQTTRHQLNDRSDLNYMTNTELHEKL